MIDAVEGGPTAMVNQQLIDRGERGALLVT
jgi:hypothetical protein